MACIHQTWWPMVAHSNDVGVEDTLKSAALHILLVSFPLILLWVVLIAEAAIANIFVKSTIKSVFVPVNMCVCF